VAAIIDDLLDADTAAYLRRHPAALAQLVILAELLAVTGGRLASAAGRCPRCKEEDGLQVLFVATGARVRCIRCRKVGSLAELLSPPEVLTPREQITRVMATRPRRR